MRRLHHKIYLSILGVALLGLVLTSIAGHLLLGAVVKTHFVDRFGRWTSTIAAALPGPGASNSELQVALERSVDSHAQAAVWSARGERLALTTADVPPPRPGMTVPHWLGTPAGPALATPAGERWIVVMFRNSPSRPAGFLLAVFVFTAALAIASYPISRRITRRLETLEASVRQLGAGDLRARVETCGNDEIASLGQSFNWTAERLERLVEGRKRVLASASHELRSPLARLRLALELARDDPQRATARLDEAVGEVAELDRLVEELLTAGRLDLLDRPDAATRVDGAAVLASEAARIGASVASSAAVELCVDERLLRTMIRNLLENAHRHGGDSAVEAGIETIEDGAGGQRIWVADRGPGIPEIERERIFEPFYRAPGQSEGQGAGVGLGLALVRRIAEHYGGSATCRPRDDGGTIFEVVLRTGAPS